MWPFNKKPSALDLEVDEALRLWHKREQSKADMAAWQKFRDAGLERRGLLAWTVPDHSQTK